MLQIFFIILGIISSLFCTGQLYSFKTFEGGEVLIEGTVSTWEGVFLLTPIKHIDDCVHTGRAVLTVWKYNCHPDKTMQGEKKFPLID